MRRSVRSTRDARSESWCGRASRSASPSESSLPLLYRRSKAHRPESGCADCGEWPAQWPCAASVRRKASVRARRSPYPDRSGKVSISVARPAISAARRISLWRRVRHTPGDILGQRRAEQKRLLRNEANLPPQFFRIEAACTSTPPNSTVPCRRIEQARDQVHQRRLAAARMPHDRNRLARRDRQIDPASASRVAESSR